MKNVLLIDSGSGGVNILKECVKIVPHCNYLMFCDNKNLPYGNKGREELESITLQNLKNIYSFFKFDIVVLACNTLTCTCIEKCREVFPNIIFIGTVPAIKPAMEKYNANEILVVATEATIKHNVLINKNTNLLLKPMPRLASEIDMHLDELEILRDELESELSEFEGKVKGVVLGCTHYLAVRDILSDIFENKVEIFDSANGVARRLKYFVGEAEKSYQVQMMVSEKENLLAGFWNFYLK